MPGKRQKTGKRRARGSGALFYSPQRNLWIGRRVIGRTAGGHTRYQEVSAPTQAELLERLGKLLPPSSKISLREWCGRWLDSLTVRPRTRDSYTHTTRDYVIPTLGHLTVAQLSPAQIEHAAREWGKVLEPGTVRLALAHLHTAMQAARRAGLIHINPVALAVKPKQLRRRVEVFTAAELARIIGAACEREGTWIHALLASTGCRCGEAMALEVSDFDSKAGTVRITKTAGPRGIGPPKSANSVRTIRVPAPALPALTASAGKRKRGYLFPSDSGGGWKAHNVVRSPWVRLLARLNLPYRNLHVLRHSVATHLVASGLPLGDVGSYLGDSVQTVVRVYCHPTGADAGATLEGLLGA